MSHYKLTPKQNEVLQVVCKFQSEHARKPTHGELSRIVGRNKSSVSSSLRSMESNGIITTGQNLFEIKSSYMKKCDEVTLSFNEEDSVPYVYTVSPGSYSTLSSSEYTPIL